MNAVPTDSPHCKLLPEDRAGEFLDPDHRTWTTDGRPYWLAEQPTAELGAGAFWYLFLVALYRPVLIDDEEVWGDREAHELQGSLSYGHDDADTVLVGWNTTCTDGPVPEEWATYEGTELALVAFEVVISGYNRRSLYARDAKDAAVRAAGPRDVWTDVRVTPISRTFEGPIGPQITYWRVRWGVAERLEYVPEGAT